MNTKAFAAFLTATAVLLGCSTPVPEAVEVAPLQNIAALPPGAPKFESRQFMVPKAPDELVFGRVCRLGTSCLALDPRPFEPCLVGTKSCRDKAHAPVEVQGPVAPQDGVQEISMQEVGAPKE